VCSSDLLAARLAALVASGAQIERDGQVYPLGYGDIAILCRASTSFSAYEDALERAGVPFLTVAGRGFYNRPEVRDVLNALQALADPTDDLALAGLLRSPALALSDAALYRLCEARGDGDSLWDTLRSAGPGLPGDDGPRAARAADLIAKWHGQVGRSPVADVLKAFLDDTGYRAALIQAGHTQSTGHAQRPVDCVWAAPSQPAASARGARNIAKLLADAHASDIVGVGEFLEYVGGLRDAGAREGEARATAEGAVQIMTVHAAKGLEFPVVVIGDATYGGRSHSGVLVDSRLGVLVPLQDEDGARPATYRLGQAGDADQDAAESDRLCYVAATRARELLIVSGCIGLKQDGTPGKLGGWLGQLAGPECLGLSGTCIAHDEAGDRAHRLDLRVGETPVACTVYEPGHECALAPAPSAPAPRETLPLAVPLVAPPWLAPVSPGVEAVDDRIAERDRLPPQRVWRVVPAVDRPTAPAWVVGSLVHEALAAWRFPGEGFDRWAAARAREYGLADARLLNDAVTQSRRALARFRQHPLCREMDAADQRLHEVPYSRLVDGHVESGIIDALYQRDGLWTLVEFKTDRVTAQTDLASWLADRGYPAQVQRYLSAVEHLLGQRPRGILCLLDHAGAVRLGEVT
ncbi:MAG: PD-(D/E)XK nuclease family protein, partial [Chloroflexi bacterium]|nr:PD-(D/E)XK nuclease family protein [Chloroflexota bacterium]MBU1749153.1 PD-(D/E)XK nuclease family protein [Chloroflexota bacterium]